MRTKWDGHVRRAGTCLQCNQPFTFQLCRQRTQKFCSSACYFANKKASALPLVQCRDCGQGIIRKRRRILCDQCYKKAPWTPTYIAICEHCGAEVRRNGFRKGSARFCSYECKNKSQERRISQTCKHCGLVRVGPPHKLKRRQYCSPKCVAKSRKETLPERHVRHALEGMSLIFIPQHRIGRFTIDFYLPLLNVAVEVDGNYWHNPTKDSKKELALSKFNIHVVRLPFSDSQKFVRSNVVPVLRRLLKGRAR